MPTITEQDAREALLNYVSQNCCYGKGAAEDLKFTDLKSTSAFHVRVELSGKCDTIYFQIQNNLIFTFKHHHCSCGINSLGFCGSSAEIYVNGNSEILINQSINQSIIKPSNLDHFGQAGCMSSLCAYAQHCHCVLFSVVSMLSFFSVHFGNLWGR